MAEPEAAPLALTVWTLPVLPLKNTVLLPSMFMPLSVGRPGSLAAVEAALATEDKAFVVVAQRDASTDTPTPEGLYPIGVRAVVRRMARGAEGVELLVQGVERVTILRIEETEPYFKGRVQLLPLPEDHGPEVEAIYRAVLDLAKRALELAQTQTPVDIDQIAAQAGDPLRLVYLMGSMLSLDVPREQALLGAATRPGAATALRLFVARGAGAGAAPADHQPGLVLPIGGVKEKVLAARRAGIHRVILPKGNEKDLRDLPEHVRRELEIVFAERIEEVLAAALPSRAGRLEPVAS